MAGVVDSTLVKGLSVLQAAADSSECGVSELAERLELHRSEVHRLLGTLVREGYMGRRPNGRYAPTLKVWELGVKVHQRIDLRPSAISAMRRLADATRETVHLSVLDGWEVLYVEKIDSPEPVRAYSELGGRAPAYAVATGKAMLAHTALDGLPPFAPLRFTPTTIQDLGSLEEHFKTVRNQGYAINLGEWRADVAGLAVPILCKDGVVVGAIGISGPRQRLTDKALRAAVPLVKMAANEVYNRLTGAPGGQNAA